MHQTRGNTHDSIETAAARWLAMRDRGMTATEQDAYLQWLGKDPAHGTTIARLERTWQTLDHLSKWRPPHNIHANPDLLAPSPKRSWRWLGFFAAAAAIVVISFFRWPHNQPQPRHHQAIIHPGPERIVLEDGSVIELNAGAKVEVRFTPEERRVQLVQGEAHFSVAKNPARPFIVSAAKFAVRAVGTAFSVAVDRDAVSVLVTEGKVRLDESHPELLAEDPTAACREISHLVAGQKAVISIAGPRPLDSQTMTSAPQIYDVTPAEIERALAWQGLRLEFVDMPLGDVIAEFNRYNGRQLVVADAKTADIVVGGNFRADNVDTFVRLLDTGFGVSAQIRGSQIVLRRSP